VVEYSTIIRAGLSLRLQITARLGATSPHWTPKGICGRILSEMMIAGALALRGFDHNVDKPAVAASDRKARRFIVIIVIEKLDIEAPRDRKTDPKTRL
jgi:hypothetical protein